MIMKLKMKKMKKRNKMLMKKDNQKKKEEDEEEEEEDLLACGTKTVTWEFKKHRSEIFVIIKAAHSDRLYSIHTFPFYVYDILISQLKPVIPSGHEQWQVPFLF